MSKQTNNKAGAKYGVGYCDAQCARDLKFVGGKVRPRTPPNYSINVHSLTTRSRPTLRAGLRPQMMPMQASGHTAVVAPKLMSGMLRFYIPNSLRPGLTSPCFEGRATLTRSH